MRFIYNSIEYKKHITYTKFISLKKPVFRRRYTSLIPQFISENKGPKSTKGL